VKLASILAAVILGGLFVGCDADVDAPEGSASAWVEVAATRFASDGESELVEVPVPVQGSVAALALRVTSDPGVCFQLSALVDGGGATLVEGRTAGPFCRECGLRSSVALESGVFMLPADTVALAGEDVSLRFGQVDCETLTPLRDPDDRPPLRIDAQAITAEHDTIDLRFLIAADSILAGDSARQQAILAALADELASAGLSPRLVAVVDLDAPAEEVRFHAGDHAALAAMLQDVPAREEATIDVVFGGCLLYDDPIFGPPRALEGYTPRIPGGAGPADGVFMPGSDCFAIGAGPVDVPVGAQAHVLAHELGHYLGLYHAVEADGFLDQLEDTDADNVMHYRPGLATSVGFSPTQGRVMQMHPAARAE
jgi:hypothetical protein